MKQRGIGKQINGNLGNVFRRTALGMLFLYFVFASYYLLGIEAVVVTSFFFLLAQFSPFFLRMYDKHKGLLKAKRTKHSSPILSGRKVRQCQFAYRTGPSKRVCKNRNEEQLYEKSHHMKLAVINLVLTNQA